MFQVSCTTPNTSALTHLRRFVLSAYDDGRNVSVPFISSSVGHKGKFGHEFMEFEFSSSGKLRYANNSNYKNDSMIRKEVTVSQAVLDEVRRIIEEAEIIA